MAKMLGIVTGLELESKLCLKAFKSKSETLPLIACAAGTVDGAQRAANQLIEQGATRLISFGVCGGLAAGVETGDLILPATVMMEGETLSLKGEWFDEMSAQLSHAKTGALVSVKTAVTTAEKKAELHARSHAIAVDVESFAVMKAAHAHNLQGLVIRAVLDPSNQALPPAALNGVNEKGETQIWPVIKGLMKRPRDLPDLIRLGGQNKRACGALAAAIETAEFDF